MRLGSILLALWEIPQNMLGLVLLGAERALGTAEAVEADRDRLFVRSRVSAVSLGYFVFHSRGESRYFVLDEHTRDHEWGHSFQSRMLGPLYLPLIGVPSAARVVYAIAFREVTGRRWEGYFDAYPEDWADRLGGVARGGRARRPAHRRARARSDVGA